MRAPWSETLPAAAPAPLLVSAPEVRVPPATSEIELPVALLAAVSPAEVTAPVVRAPVVWMEIAPPAL